MGALRGQGRRFRIGGKGERYWKWICGDSRSAGIGSVSILRQLLFFDSDRSSEEGEWKREKKTCRNKL
jgi:hypothetical protein